MKTAERRDPPRLSLRIKRNAQARRVSIRVSAEEGVVVVAPLRMRTTAIAAILERQRSWITTTMERLSGEAMGKDLPALLEILGETLNIERCLTRGCCLHRSAVTRADDRLTVCIPPDADARPAVRAWCRSLARAVLPELVRDAATRSGFAVGRVTIRDQRTRWGSCSRAGTISLNWRLVLLPPGVMHYLIIHELAHTRVMNHGRDFWRVVGTAAPDYRAAEGWLRTNARRIPL